MEYNIDKVCHFLYKLKLNQQEVNKLYMAILLRTYSAASSKDFFPEDMRGIQLSDGADKMLFPTEVSALTFSTI